MPLRAHTAVDNRAVERPIRALTFGLLGGLVLVAATPTLVSVILHHVFRYMDAPERRGTMDGFQGALTVTAGIVYMAGVIMGPTLTALATLGTLIATFLRFATRAGKLVLWLYVALSWAGVWFMSRNVRWG